MFTGIFTKIFGVGLVAALLLCGFLYIQNLRKDAQVQEATGRAEVAESNLKTAEKTIQILKEFDDVEAVIENSPDDDVAYYLSHGVWRDSKTEGNRLPTSAGPSGTGKPGER